MKQTQLIEYDILSKCDTFDLFIVFFFFWGVYNFFPVFNWYIIFQV